MTRAVRDRILKDVNSNISDHLRNHIHLTNCIHLKNHMHKHSPILANRALMRDLVVLQRSRSLKDPSASPPSRRSPPAFDVLLKRVKKDDLVSGRQSVGTEHPKECGRTSGGSPSINGVSASKPATSKLSRHNNSAVASVSDCGDKDVICEHRRVKREESSVKFPDRSQDGNHLVCDNVSGNSELGDKSVEIKGSRGQGRNLKTLSDQLKDPPAESDDAASSHNHGNGRHSQREKNAEEAGVNFRQQNGLNRAKRHRFRGTRRSRPSRAHQETETQNEMSVASNSFARGIAPQRYHNEEGFQEDDAQNVNSVPRNGCGIPWNWSRIHQRGKSFLDMAGQSLSCGLSESRFKKGGYPSQGRDIPDMPIMSEFSGSSPKSEGEALPLLLDASGSQRSIDHAVWIHDDSGELGIFSDNLLKQETDSDLASAGRSHEQHKFWEHRNGRHQNLTQKYMPGTFRDLVGQHLVVRALSNAIVKKKVGMLYLFYGPHGTGKTSCARIFARALNCQSLEHPKPCGFCNPCVSENKGKSRNVKELGPISNFNSESIIDNLIPSQLQSQYRVLIFDECDSLASECWSAILKVIDQAPRRVVFVLVCSGLEALPHVVISRCQKFFFPKLKDADIIYTLQWIATKEYLEIDKEALKLIASRSDGSLRDAEMTLEQLSLIGKRISVGLVQELVGLVSEEKLVDLLDLALSADTVNTVKNLRDILESGVEPLALISQLATIITDILAGSYDFIKERPRRKFFRQQALSKENMEKLRQALKTLSETEKHLRVSNDRITWLTAALLQLAPDQQYMPHSSSADTSFNHGPLVSNDTSLRERPRKSNVEMPTFQAGSLGNVNYNAKLKGTDMDGNERDGGGEVSQQVYLPLNDKKQINKVQSQGMSHLKIEEIWSEVLEKIPINSVKEFMYTEGKLISVSYGTAPTVQLLFTSELTKSKAEKFRLHILQAFESALQSPVIIEIRCESRKVGLRRKLLPATRDPSCLDADPTTRTRNGMPVTSIDDIKRFQNRDTSSSGANRREIVEIEASPSEYKVARHKDDKVDSNKQNIGNSGVASTQNVSTLLPKGNPSLSLVPTKLSLAHVIQQVEGCSHSGWSKRKAVSIAEKLEQENLRLEPRSRRLLCWNPPNISCRKLSPLKIRTRKPRTLLKFVSCGRCLSGRSPRSNSSIKALQRKHGSPVRFSLVPAV